ncbi:MAG: tetratricopeptide repeat protein [Gemmataceae bacterium]
MSDAGRHILTIFGEALDCASPAEQSMYLDRACGGDAALRDRVEALLRAHQRAGEGDFLLGPTAQADRAPPEAPGAALGPYKVVEPIGEGGFGVVFLAEQQQPVRRLVALKVIKPGMDSKQVIARFEAERQALALMDHPNIAKVLDAGETPPAYAGGSARPYFVMELVKGAPITDFCDQNQLPPRQRLALFVSVCSAVQHAHQKGVIHRDLKPSNVLVTLYDGLPVVKVIDFGIAKAIDQRLTDKTLVTGLAQVVGTPLYMSPEQAEMSGLDIDTRSDIYSLGVLLYELLTGTTPFDKDRLRQASFDELRRILREEEPPRPSTRISTLGPAAVTVSDRRQTDPKRLGQLVRGELDWIAMRCLEKDRNRRYESAASLARDVERYLADEPVEACPPSAGYRLRKLARKHRRLLLTSGAFLALLLGGGAITAWQAVRLAQAELEQAVQQARRGEEVHAALDRAAELQGQARSAKAGDLGKWAEARAMARRAEALVESGPVEPGLGEQVKSLLGALDREEKDRRMVNGLAEIRLRKADLKGERFDTHGAGPRYAAAFREYGLDLDALPPTAAVPQLREVAIREELLAALDDWIWSEEPSDPRLSKLRAVADGADDNAWRRDLRAAAGRRDGLHLAKLAKDPRALEQAPAVLALFGEALQVAGRPEEAADWLRQAQRRHGGDFWLNDHLAFVLFAVMQPPRTEEAVGYFRATVALRPESPGVHYNLGNALRERGDLAAAVACYRQALALDRDYASAHVNLGFVLSKQGDRDGAAAHFRQALELAPKHALARTHLGALLAQRGDLKGAAAHFRQAIADDRKCAPAHNSLGALLDAQGDPAGAAACFRHALESDPNHVRAHYNLGIVSRKLGDPAGAAASFRRATELQPDYLEAHNELARTLGTQKSTAAAIASYRRLLELKPKDARGHYYLGVLLGRQADTPGAVASYRKAVEVDPKYAEAHCDLGNALIHLGDFRAALVSLRTGHELGSQQKGWRHPSAEWVKDCERWLDLEGRLPAILKGNTKPASAAERIELADLCRYKRLYADSVRLFSEAFAADDRLAADVGAGHRYRAASSAVLAGCGQGVDAARLDEADRAPARQKALVWLRDDLAGRADLEGAGPTSPGGGQSCALQRDAVLAGVRDAGPSRGCPTRSKPSGSSSGGRRSPDRQNRPAEIAFGAARHPIATCKNGCGVGPRPSRPRRGRSAAAPSPVAARAGSTGPSPRASG